MNEQSNQAAKGSEMADKMTCEGGYFQIFDNLADFSRSFEAATGGITLDLASVIGLQTNFIEASEQYLLLNIKEYDDKKPDNMLYLSEDKVFAYSGNCPSISGIKNFGDILDRPFGKSTILCFIILDKIMDNHKKQLDSFVERIRKQEEDFDYTEYRGLSLEIDRFDDRLEEFHDMLLELQERRHSQIKTQYLAFDYRVLIAESQSLQGRCRRRIGSLKEIRQEHEMEAAEGLNQRIMNLNDVVRRLTAITVILMLPTMVSSHFGMNFVYMPELRVWWAYPSVILGQVMIIAVGIVIFRKKGWL
ncbi:MAG: CorA family divalent cation transporter [Dehalococcoidales bacterium]|nr:CorA family divalent cation transporter [Dehalococcoidales bacterium]